MNDDAWSHELARMAREEQEAERARLDDRWDRLSAGDLTAEEEAELRALAAESEEGRAAYEAFRPLGPDFQARVVQALQAQKAAETPAPPAAVGEEPPAGPTRKILSFPRGRARRISGWSAVAAAAAAVLVVVLHRPPPPLPGYRVELVGGYPAQRGPAAPPPAVFALGSPFELTLRPDTAVVGKVAVLGCLEGGGTSRPWKAPLTITDERLVKVAGTVGPEVALAPGDWTLRFAVGRPGDLPDGPSACAEIARGPRRGRDWVVLDQSIRVR
jgi:hypothetical protein